MLLRSADMHKMALPDTVLAVARAGAGTNNIPVAALAARGIPVFNTPGANANAVKELVIAGLFLAARNIAPAWQFARAQTGDDAAIDAAVEKGKKDFVGLRAARPHAGRGRPGRHRRRSGQHARWRWA